MPHWKIFDEQCTWPVSPVTSWCVQWGEEGSSSSEHQASALPDRDPPLRSLHIHGPQKDSLQRLHFRWDTVTEKRTPCPCNYSIIHSPTRGLRCGFIGKRKTSFFWFPHLQEMQNYYKYTQCMHKKKQSSQKKTSENDDETLYSQAGIFTW